MENARQFDVNVYPRVGSVLSLGIRRGLQFMSVTVPVVERADDPARVADLINRERNLVPELGILALQMNEDILQMLPWVRQRSGVVVAARAAGSPRVNSRLEAGDVIYAVNGQAVATISQLSAQLQALAAGDAVVLHVDRRGQLRYLAFQRE
jgi:serine protease Do